MSTVLKMPQIVKSKKIQQAHKIANITKVGIYRRIKVIETCSKAANLQFFLQVAKLV